MMLGSYAPSAPSRMHRVRNAPVTVYGTRWCAMSQMVRRHLDRLGIPYRYVDLETDPEAAAQVRWLTGGYLSHPTVTVAGTVLVEPTIRELDWALERASLSAMPAPSIA
ncbi:MAG: glutaredoxin family protein [Isosphaeraceae bacterium]